MADDVVPLSADTRKQVIMALELTLTAYYKSELLDLSFTKLWPSRAAVVKDALIAVKGNAQA